ncbi:MAG: class I SAM-dependent methyltransferase [Clostridiales Family XIII bacterium]|jgi:tRNA (adenine22-N1)-methyltransferase|nr:class I SAM-dependent methyltransferase [Clostridiales Family XIII bacterium]
MYKLSERLSVIAGYVAPGSRVADIGTDHGYLPRYLLAAGISPFVVLTDVAEGPLGKARVNMSRLRPADAAGCSEQPAFVFRLGDGLAPLAAGEVDTVVIAGLGGELISRILARDAAHARSFATFILQPRSRGEALRTWLGGNGFRITHEDLAREGKRISEVLVARHAGAAEGTEAGTAESGPEAGVARVRQGEAHGLISSYCDSEAASSLRSVERAQLQMLAAAGHPLLPEYLEQKMRRERRILSLSKEGSPAQARATARLSALQGLQGTKFQLMHDFSS